MHAAHLVAELAEPAPGQEDSRTDPFFDIVLADPDLLAREFEEVVAGLTPGDPPSGAVATQPAPDGVRRVVGPPPTDRLGPLAGPVQTAAHPGQFARSPPEGRVDGDETASAGATRGG